MVARFVPVVDVEGLSDGRGGPPDGLVAFVLGVEVLVSGRSDGSRPGGEAVSLAGVWVSHLLIREAAPVGVAPGERLVSVVHVCVGLVVVFPKLRVVEPRRGFGPASDQPLLGGFRHSFNRGSRPLSSCVERLLSSLVDSPGGLGPGGLIPG